MTFFPTCSSQIYASPDTWKEVKEEFSLLDKVPFSVLATM